MIKNLIEHIILGNLTLVTKSMVISMINLITKPGFLKYIKNHFISEKFVSGKAK